MARKYIIIGNDAVALYRVNHGVVNRIGHYAWDDEEFDKNFLHSMNVGSSSERVTLLFDMIEQQYKKEILPKINIMDKAKVIKRRVALAFPSNPIREALDLKRKTKDNKGSGDMYLFASIPPCPELDKVIELIEETKATIDGLYLLPLEGGLLINELSKHCFRDVREKGNRKGVWTVLITYNRVSGLRQIVVHDNELALTRLTPLEQMSMKNPNLANEMVKEFRATLTYLARFGYQEQDEMDVIAICNPEDANILHNAQLPVSHLVTPTPFEAIQLLKRKLALREGDDPNSNSAGVIFAAGADAINKRVLPMVYKSLQSVKTIRTVFRAILLLSFIGIVGVSGYAGWLFKNQLDLYGEIEQLQTRQSILRKEHVEQSKMFDVLKYPPEQMKAYLGILKEIESRQVDWSAYVERIFNALGSYVRVKKVHIVPSNDLKDLTPGAYPIDYRPDVVVTVEIEFSEALMPKEAARQTKMMIQRVQQFFPEIEVGVPEVAGEDISAERALSGVSGMETPEDLEKLKTKTTVIELRGAAL